MRRLCEDVPWLELLADELGLSRERAACLFQERLGIAPDELRRFLRSAGGAVRPGEPGPRTASVTTWSAAPSAAAGPFLQLRMPWPEPFDVEAMLALLSARVARGAEVIADRAYRRSVAVGKGQGVLEIRDGGSRCLDVQVWLDDWSGLVHAVEGVRRLCNLDVDAAGAARWLDADPLVGQLVRRHPGVRPPGCWDPFEAAVKAVLACGWDERGAQWLGSLVQATGEPIDTPLQVAGGLVRLFPGPEQIAQARPRDFGLPFAKAHVVSELARAVLGGSAMLDPECPLPVRLRSLSALTGIGPVTATRYAWILGEPDVFPDKAGAPPPESMSVRRRRRAHHMADRWRPYRSFAYAQLALSERSGGATRPETPAPDPAPAPWLHAAALP